MNCQQCGSTIDPSDQFCQNCGAKNINATASMPIESSKEVDTSSPAFENVSDFFRNSFLGIIKSLLSKPIEGTREIFIKAGPEAYRHALILIFTTGAAVFILYYLFFDKYLDGEGMDVFIKAGLITCLVLFIISILSYFVKTLSGKPDFKKELLTGGVCGIPIILLTCYNSLFGSSFITEFGNFDISSMVILNGLVTMFVIFMLINIVQQSLRSSNSNDAISWYGSPLIILTAFYIGIKLGLNMLF
jgi:hypothetical protein